MKQIEAAFLRAANPIADANALVIAAGAGMGVDSGRPNFRGNESFWRAYPALAKAQVNFSRVASGPNAGPWVHGWLPSGSGKSHRVVVAPPNNRVAANREPPGLHGRERFGLGKCFGRQQRDTPGG